MHILITGAAGFIGSHLAERLLTAGHKVIGMDNLDPYYDPAIKKGNLKTAQSHSDYQFFEGDIRDADILHSIFVNNNIDLIVHLAAKAGVRPSLTQAPLYYDVNVTGTLNLLETMRQFEVRKMIFASSSSVYGNNKKVPFSELDPVDHPISPYAATKKSGELMCYNYHHLFDFDIFCLRYFTVYGPRQRPEMAISYFTKNIKDGKSIRVFGDGTSRRDYTYIDDIVQGVCKSIENLSGYEVINLGESATITLTDLIGTIEDVVGKKAIIERLPMQPGDVNQTFADITKARTLLGYNPTTLVRDGIEKYYEWAMGQGLLS